MTLEDINLDMKFLNLNVNLIDREMKKAQSKNKNYSNPYNAKFSSNNPMFNI